MHFLTFYCLFVHFIPHVRLTYLLLSPTEYSGETHHEYSF